MGADFTMTEPGENALEPDDTGLAPPEPEEKPLKTGLPDIHDKMRQARQEGNSWADIDGFLAQKREQAAEFGYSDEDIDKFLGYEDPRPRFNGIHSQAKDLLSAANPQPGATFPELVGAASGGLFDIKGGDAPSIAPGPLPIELRNEYAQALASGQAKDAGDFAEKYGSAIGAAASFGGEFAPGQVEQFSGVTRELRQKLPETKALIDYSIGLTPPDGDAAFTQKQLMQRWVQTGETPDQLYQRAQTDDQLRMELTTPRLPDKPSLMADIQAWADHPPQHFQLENLFNVLKAGVSGFGSDEQAAYDYLNEHFGDARNVSGLGPQFLRSSYALLGAIPAAFGAVSHAIEQYGEEIHNPGLARGLNGMLEAWMAESMGRGGAMHLTPEEMNPAALARINRAVEATKPAFKTILDAAQDTRASGPSLRSLIPDKDKPVPPISTPEAGARANMFTERDPVEFLDPKNKRETAQVIHDDLLARNGANNNDKTNFDFRTEQPMRRDHPEWFTKEFGEKIITEIEDRGVTGKPVSPEVAEWEKDRSINGMRQGHWDAMEQLKERAYNLEKVEGAPDYEPRPMPNDYIPRRTFDTQRADPNAPAWAQESGPTAFGSKRTPGLPSLTPTGDRQFYVREYQSPQIGGDRVRRVQEHGKVEDEVKVGTQGTDNLGKYTVRDATIKEINEHTAKAAEEAAAREPGVGPAERARPAPIYRMLPFENLRDALLDTRYRVRLAETIDRNRELMKSRGLFTPVDDARAQQGNWQKDVPPGKFKDQRTGEEFDAAPVELPGFRGWVPKPFAEELERLQKDQGLASGSALLDVWNRANTLMLRSLFISPVPHTLNVLGHWAMGRGLVGTMVYPGLPSAVANGARAYLDVKNAGPISSAIEREGAGLQYGRILGQRLNQTYLEQMAREIQTNPTVWETAAKSLGLTGTKDLVAALYNATNRNLWFMNDVMAVQRVMELQQYNKLSLRAATRQMQREIVNYDIPVRVLGQKWLGELLSDNKILEFGRYDYGRTHLFTNMIKDMVGAGPEGVKGMAHGWDQALMFAAMTYGVYQTNQAIKNATGYDVKLLSGPLFLADVAKKIYDGDTLGAIPFHIAPALEHGVLALKNLAWSGKPLIGSQKTGPGKISDAIRAAAGMIPPAQTALNIATGAQSPGQGLARLTTGINVRSPEQQAAAEKFKASEARRELGEERRDTLAQELRAALGLDELPPAAGRTPGGGGGEPRTGRAGRAETDARGYIKPRATAPAAPREPRSTAPAAPRAGSRRNRGAENQYVPGGRSALDVKNG